MRGNGSKTSTRELIKIAYLQRRQGNFEKASELFGMISKRFLEEGCLRKHLAFKAQQIECEARLLKKKRQFETYVVKLCEAENIWHQLENEENATWCRANIESAQGISCFKANKYEEAVEHYATAKEAFLRIGLDRPAKNSEAYYNWAGARILKNTDPMKASILLDAAANLFREAGSEKNSRICEAESSSSKGSAKLHDGDFQGARAEFLKAKTISEELGSEKFSALYEARACECNYRVAKLNGNIGIAIEALQTASQLFCKAGAQEAHFVSMGDLYRLKGFCAKTEGVYEEAIKNFQDARDCYTKAAEASRHSGAKHMRSARYMDALISSTSADHSLVFKQDLKEASKLYQESSQKYRELGDESSASFHHELALLLKSFSDEQWDQFSRIARALYQHYSVEKDQTLTAPSIVHNVIKLVSQIAVVLEQRQQLLLQELYEEDAGFGLEARVRELIRCFDGRVVRGSLLKSEEERVTLHKYDDVQEKSFEPEENEVGIVFHDKSIIEIDVLAVRRERERQFILLCECKYRGRKPILLSDLDLLERKAKFVEVRYGKIARLAGEPMPAVEEKWFVTTSYFEDRCIEYARQHNIRLIDLKGLNGLLQEFRLRRILGPRPKTSES